MRARELIPFLIVALLGSTASAVDHACVAGGTDAAPLDYRSPATWTPFGVPDASSNVVLSQPCHVRCLDRCDARTLDGNHPDASLEIAPGARLTLHGCDETLASAPSTYECGGSNGFRFAPQGAVVHDSSSDGEVVVAGSALPDAPDRMRLVLDRAIDVRPGDWLQIRGGPTRGHVHRVVGAYLSHCPDPTGCYFDVELHDPAMEWGRNPQTNRLGRDVAYVPSLRTAAAGAEATELFDPDRCVETCTTRDGDGCESASVLDATHSYVGWYLSAGGAAPVAPAGPGPRMLVVKTENNAPSALDAGGVVDRICLADRIPAEWRGAGAPADLAGVLWPGFAPGDPWVLFRPATVRYAGAEGDGGLGFHAACLDADFAVFDGWAKVAAHGGTPECQEPLQDSVVTAWARGMADRPFDQQAGCNGHSFDVVGYAALRGDRVALVDSRTPVDTSATCNRGSEVWDGDPMSGYHGVVVADTRFDPVDPPSGWLIRYGGDDGVILDTSRLGPTTFRFRDWSFFGNAQGPSTEVIDFQASAPGQIVRLENGRITQWASSGPCKGALDDFSTNVRFEVEHLLYVDPRHPGPIVGLGEDLGSRHVLDDVLAWGGAAAVCPAVRGGSVRHAWIEGWNRLVGYVSRDVEGAMYHSAGGAAAGAMFGWVPAGDASTYRDFVLTGLPQAPLVAPSCSAAGTCSMTMQNGFAHWRAPFGNGVSAFLDVSTLSLDQRLEQLLFANSRLLACSTVWGGSNGSAIGTNLLVDAPDGVAITNAGLCAGAAAQLQKAGGVPAIRAEIGGETFGPSGRVGLREGSPVVANADLAWPFAVPAAPCANGVDDDWDGSADGADAGCDGASDPSERSARIACDNGVDDDGDGHVDHPDDPGCTTAAGLPENPACDDGVDNDGDLLVDADDPACAHGSMYSEQSSCGIGFELGALAWLLRRLGATSRARPRTRSNGS